jgi:hypothetical protein
MAERELGFAGMLAAGAGPQAAWEQIRAQCSDPSVQAILTQLRRIPEGRAALDCSRQRWAAHGFPPPWEVGADQQERPGGCSDCGQALGAHGCPGCGWPEPWQES